MDWEILSGEEGSQRRFIGIGKCIYCGDRESPLQDEHIIPFAIGRNSMVCEKASCAACAKTINQEFEQFCLRKSWGTFRKRIGAPSRKRKKEDFTVPVEFSLLDADQNPIGENVKREYSVDEVPLCFPIWLPPPPGILMDRPILEPIVGRKLAAWRPSEALELTKAIAAEYNHDGPVALTIGIVDATKMMRFVAKTAHAYALAHLGEGFFHPCLPDSILGKNDIVCHFVGAGPEVPHPENLWVSLSIGELNHQGLDLVLVRLQLFPFLNPHSHVAIVGKRL